MPEIPKDFIIPDDAVLVPISGRICLQISGFQKQMYGPIHLPQQHTGDQNLGIVTQVYEPYMDDYGNEITPVVRLGDMVIIGKYSGTEVELNREKFIICREMDVLACVRTPEPKLVEEEENEVEDPDNSLAF